MINKNDGDVNIILEVCARGQQWCELNGVKMNNIHAVLMQNLWRLGSGEPQYVRLAQSDLNIANELTWADLAIFIFNYTGVCGAAVTGTPTV